jgi:hypothetical protein
VYTCPRDGSTLHTARTSSTARVTPEGRVSEHLQQIDQQGYETNSFTSSARRFKHNSVQPTPQTV